MATVSLVSVAASCSGLSTGMAAMVVQFGLAMMPRGGLTASSGLTSATTSGTSASLRHAELLSTTTAPAAATFGAYSRDIVAPADMRAMSSPEKSAVAVSSTTTSTPFQGRVLPADFAELKYRIESTGKFRSARSVLMTWPTCPVAPKTPTRMGAAYR